LGGEGDWDGVNDRIGLEGLERLCVSVRFSKRMRRGMEQRRSLKLEDHI
jgi:hypothetical protein